MSYLGFPCPARGCDRIYRTREGRKHHANRHADDRNQEHLAAYFYCFEATCPYNLIVAPRRPNANDTYIRMHLETRHTLLSDTERANFHHYFIEVAHAARTNLGLSGISNGNFVLPQNLQSRLPQPLPEDAESESSAEASTIETASEPPTPPTPRPRPLKRSRMFQFMAVRPPTPPENTVKGFCNESFDESEEPRDWIMMDFPAYDDDKEDD